MTTQLGVNSNLNVFSLLSHIKPHVLDNIFLCSQRDGFILPHVFQGFVHVIARVLNVKLRRYALAPIDELKEKFKDYGLTTLGGKETVRDRSRSPLRYDGPDPAVKPESHSA
jgi:hypothetical protein